MGEQDNIVGRLAISEEIWEDEEDPWSGANCEYDDDFDGSKGRATFHKKDYVRDFIKHNLIYCEEAQEFYIPTESPKYDYHCKECINRKN